MKKEAAARGVPLAAALPLDLLATVCRALPAAFYFANPLVEPIVLRHLDIVFGGQAANGARELLDFGFSLCDAVLRHRGHTGGVDSSMRCTICVRSASVSSTPSALATASVSRMAETKQ